MATPSLTITFRRVMEAVPSYGDVYEDVSRPGIDGHRFKYIGHRGKGSGMTGIQFYADFATANTAKLALESYQGQEAFVVDTANNQRWQVFILSIACDAPQKIVSTEANINARLTVRLDVIRMA